MMPHHPRRAVPATPMAGGRTGALPDFSGRRVKIRRGTEFGRRVEVKKITFLESVSNIRRERRCRKVTEASLGAADPIFHRFCGTAGFGHRFNSLGSG